MSFSTLIKMVSIAVVTIGFSTTAKAESSEKTLEEKVIKLQTDVEQLKKQIAVLNRNQQSIAKHTGLVNNTPKQPLIPLAGSASVGDASAEIVVVEFTDLHCPFCKRFNNEGFGQLEEKYLTTGEVRFVGKHFPIVQLHKNAFLAAQALECSRKQKDSSSDYKKSKTWLFNYGKKFNSMSFSDFARERNLDLESFGQCMQSTESSQIVQRDLKLANSIGIRRTPSFVVGIAKNGQLTDWRTFSGGSLAQFDEVIAKYQEKLDSADAK